MKACAAALLPLILFIIGCKKNGNEAHYFKAMVKQTSDVSCYLPVLDFSEDSLDIRHFTKRNDVLYTVLNLAANANVKNKRLLVSVTTLLPEEEFPCNALGISYPRLKIASVMER